MIEKTIQNIQRIEKKISDAKSLEEKDRSELLTLIEGLKKEVSELSKTHSEHAESITGFVQVSTHEATRDSKNAELLKLSLKGLTASVEELEASHPRLVAVVNRISQILADMGI